MVVVIGGLRYNSTTDKLPELSVIDPKHPDVRNLLILVERGGGEKTKLNALQVLLTGRFIGN
jgi:hypothetical protein